MTNPIPVIHETGSERMKSPKNAENNIQAIKTEAVLTKGPIIKALEIAVLLNIAKKVSTVQQARSKDE